jgi:prepilin-type N-terminal cleavage/methylation domain-containing protein
MQLTPARLSAPRRRAAPDDERGFSILEVVITISLLAIVMFVLSTSLWQVQRSESYSRGRTEALDTMRTALGRMTKDLRQAYAINGTPDATTLDVNTYVNGVPERVLYDMSGSTLTRRVNGGPAVPLQKGLTSQSIFTYTPDAQFPDVVSIVFVVKPPNLPDTTLTLNAEVTFRNR